MMAAPIEDYALVSDLHTGALISRRGSIDWLCLPRFDSPSVFGALLGTEEQGRWLLAPEAEAAVVHRSYLRSTFILQTRWATDTGSALVTEFMPVGDRRASIVRRVEGISGTVDMRQELEVRFNYGTVLPWMRRHPYPHGKLLLAIAGPSALVLRGDNLPVAKDHRHAGRFSVAAGERVDLELTWYRSHTEVPDLIDVDAALASTTAYWETWAAHCEPARQYLPAVLRSLLVLRALTHESTGGIVAAPTTSLPEIAGGERNWDYRYCWLRDAALTLEAMLGHGYADEALHWRNWLLRAVAGDPEDLQIMYAVDGARDLPERVLTQFSGYGGSAPVRAGNGAVSQYQADVVGEVMVALARLRDHGVAEDHFSWPLQRALMSFLERHLDDPDHGIWEMRGEPQYFTHSRVMMWAAFDRAATAARTYGLDGPVDRWDALRDGLRDEIMNHGFNRDLNSFTQSYGSTEVDAALLLLPQVGFLPPDDDRMLGTVARLEKDLLTKSGLLLRYATEAGLDGLEPGENPFLACSFWLVEQYAATGRMKEATALMDQLVGYSNELGLLSEEYDPVNNTMAGNFPQAFSHLALVRAADALNAVASPDRTATAPTGAVSSSERST
ncbi:glycoside hydrolase family 15 protein [Arthrobacter sp. zg-Y820]|uniref:glycoside hydrolase family 15 protein n=1 Tax=unclassified Arthrobacter TaxID=235627 RepID=UPI0022B0E99E|nr:MULTISPECIES: glycoside hydrolase family 15 protein [unclassified Arthrobacter]MDK1280364.1 glycoside hydrolase family 15 protein [Arthrobacter sp. zg.Y820]WIB09647.1 glycoside hydrolase family 15 protein [Arthrobacter sp. zg-Y820]